ncbi:MAG: ECF-type sigma factor [Gemmatimonadales bacterium]
MDITAILSDVQDGIPGAADKLANAVFEDLHRIADAAMRREQDGHTLQPTELVDAAFLKAIGQRQITWQSRAHFFAVAAQTIRHILVDHARSRRRQKRDFGVRVTFDEGVAEAAESSLDLIALDDALRQLDAAAPRQAKVVELRFFGGLEIDETAHALGISPATVKRDWTFARAFLLKSLEAAT